MPVPFDAQFLPRLRRQVRRVLGLPLERPPWVFPDDTFLISYPRSGSNWLLRLIATARFPDQDWDLDEKGRKRTKALVPYDFEVRRDPQPYPRPRLIKTHLPLYYQFPRMLYVYRDPRDVVVSYYDLSKKRFNYDGTFEMFLDEFYRKDSPIHRYGRWDDHVNGAFEYQRRHPALLLKYEDVHADTNVTLERALDFLGYRVSADAIAKSVAQNQFEQHRERARQFDTARDKGYEGGVRGAPGAGKETLTREQLERLWTELGETMVKLGYTR